MNWKLPLSTVNIPINFGLVWFWSWNLCFYQIVLRSVRIIFSETRCLQILVRPSLATERNHLGLVTEQKFCWKLLRIISIDRCYWNRFTNLGRPLFSLNHSGASAAVFTIPTPFGIAHARCYTRSEPATQSATQVRSLLLDVLSVPSTHYIPQIAFIFSLICLGCTIYLVTIKDLISSQHQPPTTIRHSFLLSSGNCAMDRGTCTMTFTSHVLHKICRIRYSLQFISRFRCSINLSLKELGPVVVFQ